MDYFRRMTKNSNKYVQYHLKNRKFGVMKCRNITVQEMLHFYGVMIWISIKPCYLGGYTSYFESISIIRCGQGYMASINNHGGWDSKVISIYCFIQTIFAYHPEFGESAVGDKCSQLEFLIHCINQASTRTSDLVPNKDFDEGGIATRSCF